MRTLTARWHLIKQYRSYYAQWWATKSAAKSRFCLTQMSAIWDLLSDFDRGFISRTQTC